MLTKRFEEALAYACVVHGGHTRKGSETPYMSHLLGVASIVLEHGGEEDRAIAGLLHDAVEDAGGRRRERGIRRLAMRSRRSASTQASGRPLAGFGLVRTS